MDPGFLYVVRGKEGCSVLGDHESSQKGPHCIAELLKSDIQPNNQFAKDDQQQ